MTTGGRSSSRISCSGRLPRPRALTPFAAPANCGSGRSYGVFTNLNPEYVSTVALPSRDRRGRSPSPLPTPTTTASDPEIGLTAIADFVAVLPQALLEATSPEVARDIASGPQYASLFMGLAASHFSLEGAMLGLEFSFVFRKAVRAGDALEMTWEVVAVDRKDSLNGDIVSLRGSVTNQAGAEVLGATGKVLVTAAL